MRIAQFIRSPVPSRPAGHIAPRPRGISHAKRISRPQDILRAQRNSCRLRQFIRTPVPTPRRTYRARSAIHGAQRQFMRACPQFTTACRQFIRFPRSPRSLIGACATSFDRLRSTSLTKSHHCCVATHHCAQRTFLRSLAPRSRGISHVKRISRPQDISRAKRIFISSRNALFRT